MVQRHLMTQRELPHTLLANQRLDGKNRHGDMAGLQRVDSFVTWGKSLQRIAESGEKRLK